MTNNAKPWKEALLLALWERYNSIHTMRERIQNITLRVMWILLWVSWWLTQKQISFSCAEKIWVLLIIIIAWIIFYAYFEDLKKWLTSQRSTAIKLEKKLWFFEGDNPLYPKKRSEESSKRPFLKYHYIMLLFWFVVLIIALIYFT